MKPDDIGPWGKTGDVEIISLERKEEEQQQAASEDFSSPFAWFKHSFKLKGKINRKAYLQLIFVPAFTFLIGNIWLQSKLMPAIKNQGFTHMQEIFMASQLYMESLSDGQKMLTVIVSLLLLFCLWSLIVHTIKRLRDCGMHISVSIIVAIFGIFTVWPLTIIMASFIPSKQDKKKG